MQENWSGRMDLTWKQKLKRMWDEHPVECIAVTALTITAVAKLVDALSSAQSRRAYSKQVDYRVMSRK